MCVIVHVPTGGYLPPAMLKAMYTHNPDGCGIVSVNGMEKGLWSYAELLEKVNAIPDGSEWLLHLRIATHGGISLENCHPFEIGKGSWLMHNGIVEIPILKPNWSDTRALARMLKNYSEKDIANSLDEIERWHGFGNRLAFWLPSYGVVTTGIWSDEESYSASNSYWKPCKKKPPKGSGNTSIFRSDWSDS